MSVMLKSVNIFSRIDFDKLHQLLDQSTPLFKIERSGQIADEAHVLITKHSFQSTNTKIFDDDVLIDPDGRRYIVISTELSAGGQILGEVTTQSHINHQQPTISVGGNAVIGNNNNAFNTTMNHNVSTIINDVQNSDLSPEDKLELAELLKTVETSPAIPKGFLVKFANFFEAHPQATAALGNMLTHVIIGTQG